MPFDKGSFPVDAYGTVDDGQSLLLLPILTDSPEIKVANCIQKIIFLPMLISSDGKRKANRGKQLMAAVRITRKETIDFSNRSESADAR